MLVALGCVTLLALGLLLLLHGQQAAHREAQTQWAVERRELLDRIQRPDRLPVVPVEQFEAPDSEVDESDAVGTITFLEPDRYLREIDEIDQVGTVAPS